MYHSTYRTLFVVLALAMAFGSLSTLAQSATPPGPLHPKSADGLMPPVYLLDPNDQGIRPMASGIPFLGQPINTASGGWAQVLAAVDLTGDNKAEATVGTGQYFDPANERQAHVFSWNGSGFTRLQKNLAGADPEAAQVLDVNLDGRPDLVMALAGSNQLALYSQTITPTAPLALAKLLAQAGAPDALAAGDFDGDLRPDLAVIAPQSGKIQFWHSTNTGLKAANRVISYPTGAYNALAVGDINNDGEDDLLALHGSGDTYRGRELSVFPHARGAALPSFTRPVTTGIYLAQSVAVGDLNGDGLDDVVVTGGGNAPDAFLNVFLQGPTGLPAWPISYATSHIPSALAIGDLNHDGREDVVVVHDGWRTLSVFLQTNNGSLAAPLTADLPYSSRYRPDALALADFNGDGGLDVGVVGREAGLSVLLNNQAAPSAQISYPPEAAMLPPGTLVVSGTASPNASRVQVRLRGAGSPWIDAPVVGGTWQAALSLPVQDRAWRIEARAIDDNTGRYQAPAAERRIHGERFAYVVADNNSENSLQDRLLIVGLSSARVTVVGDTGTERIEALSFKPGTSLLYAANANQLGIIDLRTALFTPSSSRFGIGNGAKGKITLNDVDGIAFEPATGELYGVHRRIDDKEDLLFKINVETGALIPNAFGSNKDYVQIKGSKQDIDDLAFDPTTGILYGAANNDGDKGILVKINTQTGAASEVGPFGVKDLEGLAFTSEGQLYGTTGISGSTTGDKLYLINKATGQASPIGALEGHRDHESIAIPPAGVVVPMPDSQMAAPRLDSMSINGGVSTTRETVVNLHARTLGASDSARWMSLFEYHYDSIAGKWVLSDPAQLQSPNWILVNENGQYTWQLGSQAGVKYLQAWLANEAGEVSHLPNQSFINYIPASDSLKQGQARIYRYVLRAGDQLNAKLDSSSGDADLFVWSADPERAPWVSNLSTGSDQISFTAPSDGVYQVEVRGHSATTYQLQVTTGAAAAVASATETLDPNKALPKAPIVPVDNVPSLQQAQPKSPVSAPATQQQIYLPLIRLK
jgi:hypothetical protein